MIALRSLLFLSLADVLIMIEAEGSGCKPLMKTDSSQHTVIDVYGKAEWVAHPELLLYQQTSRHS